MSSHETEETHLITEPHDGHEPEVTCPGCPHRKPELTHLADGCTCGQCEPGCQNAMCRPCCGACMNPSAWEVKESDQCEACGLHWRSPEPCARPDGTEYSLSVPHVKRRICDCRTCVEAQMRQASAEMDVEHPIEPRWEANGVQRYCRTCGVVAPCPARVATFGGIQGGEGR